jgi:hypothetical protein
MSASHQQLLLQVNLGLCHAHLPLACFFAFEISSVPHDVTLICTQASTAQLAAACTPLKLQREARAANLEPKRPGE